MKKEQLHEKREFKNARHLIEWAAETYGEDTAFSYRPDPRKAEVVKKSYIQLRDDVGALTTELISMGCPDKHCVIIGTFSYDWVVTYYATLCAGAVLVPLDPEWSQEDLAETAKRADISFLFCAEEVADKAEYIAANTELAQPTVYMCAEKYERSLESLLEAGRAKFAESSDSYFKTEIDADKLALMVFTSGTTGKGKGVMLNQRSFISDLSSVIPYIDFGKKTVGVLPMHHTYGSSVMLIGHVMIGTEVYVSAGIRYVIKELKEQEPEHLILVPLYLEKFYRKIMSTIKEQGKERLVFTMIKISNGLRKIGIDLRKVLFKSIVSAFGGKLKMVISGGAPINAEIVKFFDAIGISTLNGYGITECAPIVAVNRSRRIVDGSVGPVLDVNDVKIDEPNEDNEGEILVKGPNVMMGYYKDEAATKDAMTEDGYFRTGDYGKLEGDVLFITGRKKNLIILSNGKNVYPEEIENELSATPGVQDIVVYEGKSKRGMEHNAIVAEIFPDPDYCKQNNITDFKAHMRPYIEQYNKTAVSYKKITVVKVREEDFPKNTLRKIMRFKIDMTID